MWRSVEPSHAAGGNVKCAATWEDGSVGPQKVKHSYCMAPGELKTYIQVKTSTQMFLLALLIINFPEVGTTQVSLS